MATEQPRRPLVLITGAAGSIGRALAEHLADDYTVVGMDRACDGCPVDCIEIDLGDDASVRKAFGALRERHGERIASVVHLAAYFDFTGEPNPLYREVNVDGTARLLDALQGFDVEQFVYSSTMLVHAPGEPGQRIDESAPIAPRWAYPQSKADTEQVIAERHGRVPTVLLRLAGLYDERTMVPTLAQQVARIHRRDLQSHLYAGDPQAGQSMVHRDDLLDAVQRTIERRTELPDGLALLIGETDAPGYADLQDRIGQLLHGDDEWATLRLPAPVAKAGAWLQGVAEPLVPDAIDHGEKPFVRPFMIDLASDHYALDTSLARRHLGWQPRHRLTRELPAMIAEFEHDPSGWYERHGIPAPDWVDSAEADGDEGDAEHARREHQQAFRREHAAHLWARFAVLGLGSWMLTMPLMTGYDGSTAMRASDVVSGVALLVLGSLALSWRMANLRWVIAAIGCWVLFAPLVFATADAAVYTNATLVGTLIIGFAVAVPPVPGLSPLAATDPNAIPAGWSASPSTWMQRAPIILLAFVGLYISRHLAAYQLGHVDGIWDPLFGSDVPGRNGSEAITTSSVSEAFPVSDAGLGAMTYALEILTGLIGSNRRWRTMPWLVVLFGVMIVPLGAVSIGFIVIQPIMLGTWCLPCLIAAVAMLVQIPYSLDELLATGQFLLRRKRAGRPLLRLFFTGDRDDGDQPAPPDDFERGGTRVLADWFGGGVALPWNLAACIVIGLSLMFTRLTLGNDGNMANADHLLGALIVTTSVIALAEIARSLRWLNLLFAAALLVTPFVFGAGTIATVTSIVLAIALAVLSLRRGAVTRRWGGWERYVV